MLLDAAKPLVGTRVDQIPFELIEQDEAMDRVPNLVQDAPHQPLASDGQVRLDEGRDRKRTGVRAVQRAFLGPQSELVEGEGLPSRTTLTWRLMAQTRRPRWLRQREDRRTPARHRELDGPAVMHAGPRLARPELPARSQEDVGGVDVGALGPRRQAVRDREADVAEDAE